MKVVLFFLALSLMLNIGLITLKRIPAEVGGTALVFETVDLTAYSPSKGQTDDTPFVMASGKKARPADLWQLRYVAVSRDLMSELDLGWGDIVYIPFEIQDTMSPKVKRTVDIFMRNRSIAKFFGRRTDIRVIFEKRVQR